MIENLMYIAIGMLIGWNLLPQPVWVTNLIKRFGELFAEK